MELIFNSCGEFQWSPEGPVISQIHSPHLLVGASGIFSDLLRSVQILKREMDPEKQRKATAPIQSLVNLKSCFLSLRWRTCLWAENPVDIFMVKVSTKHSGKAHGDVDASEHIYISTTLGRDMVVASPTVGPFTLRESPCTHFILGWVDPRTSLNTKEWRKISIPPTPGIEPKTCSPYPSVLPLDLPGPLYISMTMLNVSTMIP